MRILMVHPHDIDSPMEPWTVRIVYLAKEFVKKGHAVTLVYFPLDRAAREELRDGIRLVPFDRRHGPHILMRNTWKMCRLAASSDIVHVQKCFYHASFPAAAASLFCGKPLHYDWDDWELRIYEASTEPGFLRDRVRDFIGLLEAGLPAIADSVSYASHRLRHEALRQGARADRLYEAHVGADLERFNPANDASLIRSRYGIEGPLVLYVGQLHGGQYVELFLKAASLLRGSPGCPSFMIVGDGGLAGELKKKAKELQLDGILTFTGSVPHREVPFYMAAADVCVACFEANDVTACKSPLKIVEYLASGKAIVASGVGEVPRMLEGCGELVRPGDAGSLAEAIKGLLADSQKRQRLGRLARLRAEEEYNWTVTAESLLCAYETISS